MKRAMFVLSFVVLSGCQCVRLEDYRVCDATVDCDESADASVADAGLDGGSDGGADGGCVPDGLLDALDESGLDTDCDGVDGVATRQLYVDVDQGNDPTAVPGNPARPFATLGAALNFAADGGGGYDAVLVKSGRYDELEVTWQANVDIWGGRSGTGNWGPTIIMSNLVGSRVGLVVRGVVGRTLRGFQVHAGDGPPVSIGVLVENGSPRFVDVELYGERGGTGATGGLETLADAGRGLAGFPGERSGFSANFGPPGVCGGAPGYAGGAGAKSAGTAGGAGEGPDGGGEGGAPPMVGCTGPSLQPQPGAAGEAGLDGMPGVSATAFGSLAEKLEWVGADGTPGSFGTTGKPGSGGGGGGAPNIVQSDSSSGGSGGSGGCPGARGLGGSSGGPSIGLVVRGGRPFIGANTFISSGAGGEGGPGGVTGPGFEGGDGGAAGPSPVNPECVLSFPYGIGARGGAGGRGGTGGRGGGGAGGHSFAIYCDTDGGFDLDGGTLRPGVAGAGVEGARGGTSSASQGCTP